MLQGRRRFLAVLGLVQGVRFVPSKGRLGFQGCWVLRTLGFEGVTQRAQYPLIKEYGLNYIGLHIVI